MSAQSRINFLLLVVGLLISGTITWTGTGSVEGSIVCVHHGRHEHGSLSGDSSLPDEGPGYYHYYGKDPVPDTDDWACSDWLIAKIQLIGRRWNRSPRIGIGDLSLPGGGYFKGHGSHQNGLDVDVRYFGSHEGPLDLTTESGRRLYDRQATQELIDIFCATDPIVIYVDQKARLDGSCVQSRSRHHNHFHVRYAAP